MFQFTENMGKNKKNKSGGGGGGGAGNASGGAPVAAASAIPVTPVVQATTADDNDALKVRLAEAKERLNRIQAVIGAIGIEDPKETLATETKIMAEATEKLQTIENVVAATSEKEADTLTEIASSSTGKKKKHKKGHNNNPPPGCPIAVQHPPSPKPEIKPIALTKPIEVTENDADESGDKEETGGTKKKKNKNKNKKQGQQQQVSDRAAEEIKTAEVEEKTPPVVVAPVAPVATIAAQTPSTDDSKQASPSAGGGKKKNKNKNKNKGADSENEELAEIKAPATPVTDVSVIVAPIEVKAEIVAIPATKEFDDKKEETKPEIPSAEQEKPKTVEVPVNSKANKKKNKHQNQTPPLEKLPETTEASVTEPIKELSPIAIEPNPIATEAVKPDIAQLPSSDELKPSVTESKVLHAATIHDDSGSAKIWKMLDEITDQPTLQESMIKNKKNNKREAPKPPGVTDADKILSAVESVPKSEDSAKPISVSEPSDVKLIEISPTLSETSVTPPASAVEVLPAEQKLSMADLLKLDMKKPEVVEKPDVSPASVSPITSDSPIAESKKTQGSSQSDVETEQLPEVTNKKNNKHNKQCEKATTKQQSNVSPKAPISEPENFEITSSKDIEAHTEKIIAPVEQIVTPIAQVGDQEKIEVVSKLEGGNPAETTLESVKTQDHKATPQTNKQKQQPKKGQASAGQKPSDPVVSASSVKIDQTTSIPLEINNEKVINKEMEKQLLSASLSKLIDTVPQALDKGATDIVAKELPKSDEKKPKEEAKPKKEPKEELRPIEHSLKKESPPPKNERNAENLSKPKTEIKPLEPTKTSTMPQETSKDEANVKSAQIPAAKEGTKTEAVIDAVKPEVAHMSKEETKSKGETKQKESSKPKDVPKMKDNLISKDKPKAEETPKPHEIPKQQETSKTLEKSKQDSAKPEINKITKPMDIQKPAQVQPKSPKGKSPKPQEAPKQNEQVKQQPAPKAKELETKINIPTSEATAGAVPKDTQKVIEVTAAKAKPDSPKLGRQETSKKNTKESLKKDMPKTKSPIKEDLTTPSIVPLKVATQDPPKHEFTEVPLPAAPTPPPAAAASSPPPAAASPATPDLNKSLKKDDPKSKKDQKNQKPNKTKAKAPQPPIEETPPDIPMDMSIISASMIEASPASSSGQVSSVPDDDQATAEDASLIFSDSKNVQRSDFAQSVKTVTVEKDEAKSLGSVNKIETTNQIITEVARDAAISPTSNKRNKNQANKRNAAEALESKTHELPEKTAQEKLETVEFPAVQLMDILEPKMTSGSGLKPGNVVGTVRASPRANQNQKKVAVEKVPQEVKSDQTVKDLKQDPKLIPAKTVDKKQNTGTIPKVSPGKAGESTPATAKQTETIAKSPAISQKPQVPPKPENISKPQNKKESAPPSAVAVKPTQPPISPLPKVNEKPKSPTNIKPEIPPRPKNLVSSPQPPKKSVSPLSIVPTPSSPSSSTASASPSPLPYDDEEYVEYKFSPRPVFMCTICQVCKIPLHSYVHCKQCQMISYCTVEHMLEDEVNHKSLCAAIQEIAKKRGMTFFLFKFKN